MWIDICETKNINPHNYVIKMHSSGLLPGHFPHAHIRNNSFIAISMICKGIITFFLGSI
jgi:hypothetical protein